jgi:hypothetical protein
LAIGFPRSFVESSDVRELIYDGDTWDLLYSRDAHAGHETAAR